MASKLTITKKRFIEWYFNYGQDSENKELRIDLANSIIDQMLSVGFGSYSVNELFDKCNQDSIRLFYTEEYAYQTEDFDIELLDFDTHYELILID